MNLDFDTVLFTSNVSFAPLHAWSELLRERRTILNAQQDFVIKFLGDIQGENAFNPTSPWVAQDYHYYSSFVFSING